MAAKGSGARLIVHLHASCWNEARMLPFFFRHYDRLVDRYFIYDNQSDDGSLAILAKHPKVTVLPLALEGDSFVLAAFAQVNDFWIKSRGKADWVAVVNIDEFLWHPDIRRYLRDCRRSGITWTQANGFQMISPRFPETGDNLARTVRTGMRAPAYDKPAFFNPEAVTHSGFGIARHQASPSGRIVRPAADEILLLHYKHLGLDYVTKRSAELGARLRPGDIAGKYGTQYESGRALGDHNLILARSVPVVPPHESWKRIASSLPPPKPRA
jgi:hypothetical protein